MSSSSSSRRDVTAASGRKSSAFSHSFGVWGKWRFGSDTRDATAGVHMMFSRPVLLGLLWCLLWATGVRTQISDDDSNKVYSYVYHFQHNGTTNSQEILRNILGHSGFDGPSDGQNIVRTFTDPDIRGFFTKGVLPGGPLGAFGSPPSGFGSSKTLDGIKDIVHRNLQPPRRDIATGLLPASPDIPGDFFNNGNDLGNVFDNQVDFPKISPPTPAINSVINNRDNGVSRVQSYSRNTADGGNVVGKIETFSYNSPPPGTNAVSQFLGNSQGYRQNENLVDNNQRVTGHRSQSYFRQHFRTITPDVDSGAISGFTQDNSFANKVEGLKNNNNNWWNVLGENKVNRGLNQQVNQNIQPHRTLSQHVSNDISNRLNNVFGRRLSNLNNVNNNRFINRGARGATQIENRPYNNNVNQNSVVKNNALNYNAFNNPIENNNNLYNNLEKENVYNNPINVNNNNNNGFNNPVNNNNIFNNRLSNNNAFENHANRNNIFNNPVSNIHAFNNRASENNFHNNPGSTSNALNEGNNKNIFNNFKANNDDTAQKVMHLINSVNTQLNNVRGNRQDFNNVGLTWDDDHGNVNSDWSMRQRPFSNAHSEPLNNVAGPEIIKTSLEALVGAREIPIPPIPDIGGKDGSYSNRGGGGVEKFFGVDRVVEGPNSFSRNQRRGYERNFDFNSNQGFQRSNQWSTNTVRRLDAHDSRTDFSKDFIDVFRDDY